MPDDDAPNDHAIPDGRPEDGCAVPGRGPGRLVLISLPDGKTALIDAGTLAAGSSIVTFIDNLGVK